MQLYEHSIHIKQLKSLLDGLLDGSETKDKDAKAANQDEAVQVLVDALAASEADLKSDLTELVQLRKEQEAEEAAIQKELDRIGKFKAASQQRQAALEAGILRAMQENDIKNIPHATCPVTLRRNASPKLTVDKDSLPSEYLTEKVTMVPNDTLIKDIITSGGVVPGAAYVTGWHLRWS